VKGRLGGGRFGAAFTRRVQDTNIRTERTTEMTTTNPPSAPQAPTLKAYEDKVRAQVQEAKAKLEQFEAKAKEQKAETEMTAINRLKTAKQDIDRKLQGLKTTQAEHLAHAKADIDADVSRFKASIDTLSGKLRG
jgi:wobble nucleotide-excising tRNase